MPRHVEAGRQVAPERLVLLRQNDDEGCAGQRLREAVDRAGQHGLAVEQHELFGQGRAHAASAASGHDDYSCAFHISFLPNPSVLSVSFRKVGVMLHSRRPGMAAA